MLIISGGLQKSGSGWLYNMLHDLLKLQYGYDSRKVKTIYDLEEFLIDDNNFVPKLNAQSAEALSRPLIDGKTIIIKTHNYPDISFFDFMKRHNLINKVKLLYSMRDPRDVVLSVIDHGKIQTDHPRMSFAKDIKKGVMIVFDFLIKSEEWLIDNKVIKIKYEDLNKNTLDIIINLNTLLKLGIEKGIIQTVVENYDKNNIKNNDSIEKSFDRIHFNKAISFRYKEEMSSSDLELCNRFFNYYIQAMKYDRTNNEEYNNIQKLLFGKENTKLKNRFIFFQETFIRDQEKKIFELKKRLSQYEKVDY